jgi:hypothetical protein
MTDSLNIKQSTDFRINELCLLTKGGKVKLNEIYEEINIYESMLAPCISGNILIRDAVGLTSKLLFDGTESLLIDIDKGEGLFGMKRLFRIYSQTNRTNINQQSESYILNFASDEIILDFSSFEIKPELENIARNAGIDSRGLSQAVQKDIANESMSRADRIRLEIMEESGKLDLKSKSEALRFKKELNELDLVAKEEKIKLDKLDRDIKELEIKAKNNSINSKEKLDLIEYKSAKGKLVNQRFDTLVKMKWLITSLAIMLGAVWIFVKRCDWFPSVCEWFNTNQMDDSKSNGGSKSKGGSKKSINDY